MKRFTFYIILIQLMLLVQTTFAQQKVSGVVRDDEGTLPGVTVQEKGVKNNVISTDVDGKFTLLLRGTSNTLLISSIGYEPREIKVTGAVLPAIKLKSTSQGLEEVVVQGFVNKTVITNTGAVSTIAATKIRNIPTSSVQNTLQGRLPGFFSQQRSGQPGRDASDFFIRGVSSLNAEGNRPLIVVDDIEYTYEQLAQINVNEIESISILKDASTTAIYGIKGANGVLVVKTRRGMLGEPMVNLRVESGVQAPVRVPKFLDAYQTAVLRNEALSNDGLPADFTAEDLRLFKTGEDPYLHPNVNWYDEIFKPSSMQFNGNIDISGGTPNVRYFISGGAFLQNGAVRDFSNSRSEVNSNFFYRRYTYRTNLDIKATKTLNVRIDLTGRFGEINSPRANSGLLGEIYNYNAISPYAAPVLNPNGSYSYNPKSIGAVNLTTINSRLATQGYNRERNNDFNILIGADQDLKGLTPGLKFNGRLAYASTTRINRGLWRLDPPPAFRYTGTDASGNEQYTILPGGKYVLSQFVLTGGIPQSYKSVNLQAFFNYDRTFGSHNVNGLLLFNQNTNQDLSNLPANYRGYSLKLGYGYKNRYLVDFNTAYNGTDRFARHYGYFPAISAAWNVSQEDFFQSKVIDLLKLRGSYGIVGSDAVSGNKYLYLQEYPQGGSYQFGQTPVLYPGYSEGALGNPFVTWEKQKMLNIGVELNMMKGKFALTFDYFRNLRYNQLIERNSVSQILGVGLPRDNMGEVLNRGFDGSFYYRPGIGKDLKLDFGLVFSYARNKILFQDEAFPDYPYLLRTGHSLNQQFGYTWIGYYQNDADIASSPRPVGTVPIQPGDLKYKDLNSDNIIDAKDQSAIGKPNLPNLTLGLPIGINYKGFSANILFQGSFNYSMILGSQSIIPFQTQLQTIHESRWTPQTASTALFPRLSTYTATVNSPDAYPSNFWLVDAQYIRLKTVELGYTFSSRNLPFRVKTARIYFSGYNLFTWTNYSLYQQDPEVGNFAGDSYLNQRVFNLGFQVSF